MIGYEDYLNAMQEEYRSRTGLTAESDSDVGIRFQVLAAQLYAFSRQLEELDQQMFPQTAQGQALEYHAQARGLARKQAAPASGVLRFSRATAAPQPVAVPQGTVCTLGGADGGPRYATTRAGEIPAGGLFCDVPAQAQEGGAQTNAAPGVITAMVTPVQWAASVNNPAAFTGGMDGETDEQLRGRLLQSYSSISNGTNSAFYYDFAMSFEGVASAQVVPRERGSGTVGVYVAAAGGPAPQALVEKLQAALEDAREINVDVTVQSARAVPVDVSLELAGTAGSEHELLEQAVRLRLERFFGGLAVGQALLTAALGDALYHIPGLYNYRLSAPAQDQIPQNGQLFTLGQVTLKRMAVVV